jgi:hypothetical protein
MSEAMSECREQRLMLFDANAAAGRQQDMDIYMDMERMSSHTQKNLCLPNILCRDQDGRAYFELFLLTT